MTLHVIMSCVWCINPPFYYVLPYAASWDHPHLASLLLLSEMPQLSEYQSMRICIDKKNSAKSWWNISALFSFNFDSSWFTENRWLLAGVVLRTLIGARSKPHFSNFSESVWRKVMLPGECHTGPCVASLTYFSCHSPCEWSYHMLLDHFLPIARQSILLASHVNCLSYLPAWMHQEYLQLQNLFVPQYQWCMTTLVICFSSWLKTKEIVTSLIVPSRK